MKNQAFLLFLIINVFALNAQHVPIDFQDATWGNVDYYCDGGQPCEYYSHQYRTQGDTTFNNHTYKKLYDGFSSTADLIGYIREDSLKRVYYYTIEPFCPNDTISEYLLYDFSLEVGDTLNLFMPDHDTNPCLSPYLDKTTQVVAIDSIVLANGEYRKRFMFADGDWGLYDHSYVEGIGSSIDLIYPLKIYSLDGWHVGHSSVCYLSGDTIEYIYPNWNEDNCGTDFTDNVAEVLIENRFNVFPSPTSNFIIIESTFENLFTLDLQIYSLDGRFIRALEANTNQEIPISFLQTGLYILKIETEDEVYFSRIVKL